MANGFCPALLTDINNVAGGNAPGKKLQIAGFLAALFCCQNSTVSPVNSQFTGSSYRPLTVAYRKRPTLSDVSSTDDCDIDRIPADLEWNLPALGFKKSSFFIPDDTMQQYCIDATATQSVGRPATQVMRKIYDSIVDTANILLKAINQDLVTQMATQFGLNVTTGYSTGKVININEDGTKMILDNGIIDMLRDIQENEICGTPCLVGGGLWAAWDKAQVLACCNSAGLDMSKVGLPRFFYDKDLTSIWGLNTAGLLSDGSVKFIGRNAYLGAAFSGQRGTSFFTTLPLPVDEFGCNLDDCLRDLIFDLQLRYIDCPTTINVNGQSTTVNRGWEAIISKRYSLWVQPTTAYASDDELFGTNGTLKYYLTNTTSTSHPYAYGHP